MASHSEPVPRIGETAGMVELHPLPQRRQALSSIASMSIPRNQGRPHRALNHRDIQNKPHSILPIFFVALPPIELALVRYAFPGGCFTSCHLVEQIWHRAGISLQKENCVIKEFTAKLFRPLSGPGISLLRLFLQKYRLLPWPACVPVVHKVRYAVMSAS